MREPVFPRSSLIAQAIVFAVEAHQADTDARASSDTSAWLRARERATLCRQCSVEILSEVDPLFGTDEP